MNLQDVELDSFLGGDIDDIVMAESPAKSIPVSSITGASGGKRVFCLFLMNFDIVHGQVIEYIYPPGRDITGVEMKCMPSGFHTVNEDHLTFRMGKLIGASWCHRAVGAAMDRGARMRSVGVLVENEEDSDLLSYCGGFMRHEVSLQNQHPGLDYSRLAAFYNDLARVLESSMSAPDRTTAIRRWAERGYDGFQSGLVPAAVAPSAESAAGWPGSFQHLLGYYRGKAMTFWKAMLLHKRVLLFSRVPIGVTCDHVHRIASMRSRATMVGRKYPEDAVLYYVSVNDYTDLSHRETFLACTCDKVFYDKTTLYDVYCDSNIIHIREPCKRELETTSSDRARLEAMASLCRPGAPLPDVEAAYAAYFHTINTSLFAVLRDVASRPSNNVTPADLKEMGLNTDDIPFLNALAAVHNINVSTEQPAKCCGCL